MRKSKLTTRIPITILFILGFFLTKISGQCTFNCNDTIHVSVNNMCAALLTPDIILEDPADPMVCSLGIQVKDENGNAVDPDLDFSDKKLPLLYKVRIFEQGANPENSCWAYVLFEDKLPPDIMCPPNDTIKCYEDQYAVGPNAEQNLRDYLKSKIINSLVDNCGNEEISIAIINNDLDRDCAGPFSAIQYVEYDALDKNFNATRCIDTIYYERLPMDDITPPKNYKDDDALKCYGNWDKDDDGLPSVEELIMLDGDAAVPNVNGKDVTDFFLCNFKMTYSDVLFPNCGPTFKIVRTWTVIDWCDASSPKFYYQVIKVEDDKLVVNFPDDIGDLTANPWYCNATTELPAPEVSSDECSDWTWSIMVKDAGEEDFVAFGGIRSSSTSGVSRTFPLGKSVVKYTVEDDCGNVAIDSFCVTVIDEDEPVAVCDYRTIIKLNDKSFLGKATALSFDDGSFDGCSGIVSYKVRRVDRFTTSCPTPLDWDDFVKFCCEDIGKIIMVELQVTDGVGLTNICMAEVKVQYKDVDPPVCPPDIVDQDCRTFDSFNINSLPHPTYVTSNPCLQNNLGTEVRESGRDIDDCGNGYIDVEWISTITGEEEVVCTQRVHFINTDPFEESDINWPSDRNVLACTDLDPTDSEDANLFNRDRPCSNIVRTYEDESFVNVSGFCKKVLRTWTVIDWCQFNSSTGNIGVWTHTQKIHVFGSDAPEFGTVPGIVQITEDQNNCEADVTASGLATDDCTEVDELIWTHKLDLLFGSTSIEIIPESPGPSFNRTLDIGTYRIMWTVSDHCGKTSFSSQTFEIEDKQDPNPVCKSGSGNINQNTGELIVSANSLDGGSFDNCDGNLSLGIKTAGSNSPPQSQLTFDCGDVGIQEVQLWAEDDAGNRAYCTVFYDVKDALDVCNNQGASILVSGEVRTPLNVAIEDTEVHLFDQSSSQDEMYMTSYTGEYSFEDVSMPGSYEVSTRKNDNYINGVSTLDLILIQKHILGVKPFHSPFQMIAGDASNDQSISSLDLVLLRQLILGQITSLPNNDSWRFVKGDFSFPNPLNPWPFEESTNLGDLTSPMDQIDFTGVKIGDVDQNAVANSRTSKSVIHRTLDLSIIQNKGGSSTSYSIISARDVNVKGLQLALDHSSINDVVKSITSKIIDLGSQSYHTAKGETRIVWYSETSKEIRKGQTLLEIEFEASSNQTDLGALDLAAWNNQIIDADLNSFAISTIEASELTTQVVLYQNKPNPFNKDTSIEFYLPDGGEASIEVFDLNGKKVFELRDIYPSGLNRININRAEANLYKGIYYYQLKTQSRSLAKKMIII